MSSRQVIEKDNGRLTIVSNYQWRELIYGFQLEGKERAWALKEYDHLDTEPDPDCPDNGSRFDNSRFFRYKGELRSLDQYMRIDKQMKATFGGKWNGYFNSTYSSGELIRLSDDGEGVQVGWFYCS